MKLSFATVILALAPGLVSALGVRRDTGKVLQTRKDDPPQYIPITNKYVGKPSSDLFLDPNKLVEDYTSGIGSKIKAIKRHYAARFGRREPQKHAKRNVIQGDKIFTAMCTDAGFRGDCLVFGTFPGECKSWYTFNQAYNTTQFSERFENKISSISVNTGGMCAFYTLPDCDYHGDDAGMFTSYAYDLGAGDPKYQDNITSWRC